MALQFRRGTDSDRLTITPAAGEPIFTSDTKELFIGDGSTAGGVDLITTKLGSISGDIIPDTDSTYDLGSPTKKFKDLHLSGNSIFLGAGLVLSNDGGTFAAKDSDNNPVVISLTSNNTGQLSEGTNLYYTTARADSAFDVRLATKTTANVTEGSNLYFTNARADARITNALLDEDNMASNSATKIPSQQSVKAYVDAEVAGIVDTAPAALNTLNELAAALGDDANFSATITAQIGAKLDSAEAISLIDSAYVQARTTAGTDSAATISLIGATVDSAYVQARQTSGGGSSIDSAATIALIDSSYVQARVTASGGNDSATTIALIDSSYVQVRQTPGIIQIDSSLTTGDSSQIIDQFPIGTHRTTKYIAQLSSPEVIGYTNWPAMTQQQIILGNETGITNAMGTGDEFGRGMAIGTNQLLVGSTRNDYSTDNSGVVVYYTRDSANGTWSYTDFVQPSSPAASDFFGQCIAPDSNFDTIAVTGHSEGLYIMDRAPNDWRGGVQRAFLKANSITANDDEFGKSVSISANGNYVASGAQLRDTGGSNRGEVFIHFKDSSEWSLQATIQSDDIANGDKFGNCVSLNDAGDTLVVGAWFKGGASNNGAPGAAYIFTRSGTTWTQQAKLTPSDHPGNNDIWYFGKGVDISNDGNSVIIGAPQAEVGSYETQGAAYIFNRSGTTWSQYAKLIASDGLAGDQFSGSGTYGENCVSISGDGEYAIVGAPYDDDGATFAGTAYIYAKTGAPYNITNATYTGYENIVSQFTNASDLAFNADGTKVYVVGFTADAVGQYSLSTPYLISSAVYDSVSLDVSSKEDNPKALAFSTDGTKLFVAGSTNNKIIQYNLSTAFDLSTANFSSEVSVTSQNSGIGAIRFKSDGSKLFILDNGTDSIYSYSLSSAYDLSTLVYDNISINVNAEQTVPNGMAVSADGTKVFIVGQTVKSTYVIGPGWITRLNVDQYNLTAGWDLSTASYSGTNFDIYNKETIPHGIEFSPDGNRMYICGRSSDKIHEWDVTSGVWSQQAKIQPAGLTSSNYFGCAVTLDQDGDTVVIGASGVNTSGTSYGRAYVYTRGTGSVWSQQASFLHSDYSTGGASSAFGYSMDLDHSGNVLVVGAPYVKAGSTATAGAAYIFERTGTAWKQLKKYIASNPTSGDDFGEAVAMGNDGLAFIAGANHEDTTLNNSGASYVFVHPTQALELAEWSQSYKVIPSSTGYSNAFTQCDINAAGNIAITGAHYDAPGGTTEAGTAYIYSMDSADGVWKNSLEINASDKQANDHFGHATVISGSGGVAVVAASQEDSGGSNAGAVYVYNADNNYVMHTGASGEYNNYTSTGTGRYQGFKSFQLSSPVTLSEPHGLDLHPDGSKVFLTSRANQSRVSMWTLSTPHDMQTAMYTNAFSDVETQASYITGVKFNPDGTKMFITNASALADATSEAAVFQYALGRAYDLTTAYYTGKSLTIGTTSQAEDVQFNNDGTKMFVLDDDNTNPIPYNGVREYTLSTAYDISTASYVDSFRVGAEEGSPRGLTFHPDGKRMYVSGPNSDQVFQYNLTTAFDVSTASYANIYLQSQYASNQISCHRWRADGSQIFLTNTNQEGINTYYTGGLAYTEVKKLVQTGSVQMGLDGGLAISNDGGSIFASSYYEGINGVNQQGAVYVFTGSGANWTMTQKLTGDAESSSQFGTSIAIDGDNLIIGAHGTKGITNSSINCGAAYLFTKDANGVWTERKKIQHSDADGTNRFGSWNGVAIKGTDVGVGAWNISSAKGRAYVFTTSGIAGALDASHHSEEILLMHDGTNVGLTSYGKLLLNDNLGTFNGDIVGNNAQLKLSPTRATTTVKLSAIRNKI